jgi:hypothetical protein
MPCPREVIDALESILGIYFSGIRHRERAAFILTDELIEMACKLRAREHNHSFDMSCGFFEAWNAPGVTVPPDPLGNSIQASRNNRNNMQHANLAATVDDQHCADAIMDALQVIEHCWPSAATNDLRPPMICALRIVRLYSSRGNQRQRIPFEDALRNGHWRAENRQPRVSEFIILPGRREFWWSHLIKESQVQVEAILTTLGIP